MLDQLFNIVKQMGEEPVVKNAEVPNEYNNEVMADATQTIAGGFRNILAGGGFQNILDFFKGNKDRNSSGGGGIGGLLKNPIVTMMIGYFINKLVSKYKMNPASASQVANELIPKSLQNLVDQTNDPNNNKATLDNFIGSLVGNAGVSGVTTGNENKSPLQDLLDSFTGGGSSNGGNGFDLQGLIGNLTNKAQDQMSNQGEGGGGNLMEMIKGFISK